MKTYDICIIGAGASGLAAAIEAGRRGLKCIVIDRNKKCGNKLYATGNGRCNIANALIDADSYFFNTEIHEIISSEFGNMRDLFLQIGIPFRDKGNLFYPASEQSSSVVWALKDEAERTGADLIYKTVVTGIRSAASESPSPGEFGFIISSSESDICIAKKLIIAMGSPSAPKLGALPADDIYHILENIGIKFSKFRPALSPVRLLSDIPDYLNGVRSKAAATIITKDGEITETGELQITGNTLSGIMIFNLSAYIECGTEILLDLAPGLSITELKEIIINEVSCGRARKALLSGIMNDKLAAYIAELYMAKCDNDLSNEEFADGLARLTKNVRLKTAPLNDYDRSQASLGGIALSEIDLNTMKLKSSGSISVCGEICDVTGKCGGYNLMWAFISGMRAGMNI